MRMQIDEKNLQGFAKFLDNPCSVNTVLITLFSSGIGIITLKAHLPNTSVKDICKFSRKENQEILSNYLFECTEKIDPQAKIFRQTSICPTPNDIFFFCVIRDAEYNENNIQEFVAQNVEDLYS